eukprot:jgi/Psemu1/19558/gm1.19558_g
MFFRELHRAHRVFLRYAQTHPKSLTVAVVCSSTLVGMVLLRIVDGDGDETVHPHRLLSPEEAKLMAMVEHAKESSWRENIQTAVNAQEQFMVPGRRPRETNSNFLENMEERTHEILRKQRQRREKEEERTDGKNTISYWKEGKS